jgi:hypothetical protein
MMKQQEPVGWRHFHVPVRVDVAQSFQEARGISGVVVCEGDEPIAELRVWHLISPFVESDFGFWFVAVDLKGRA